MRTCSFIGAFNWNGQLHVNLKRQAIETVSLLLDYVIDTSLGSLQSDWLPLNATVHLFLPLAVADAVLGQNVAIATANRCRCHTSDLKESVQTEWWVFRQSGGEPLSVDFKVDKFTLLGNWQNWPQDFDGQRPTQKYIIEWATRITTIWLDIFWNTQEENIGQVHILVRKTATVRIIAPF